MDLVENKDKSTVTATFELPGLKKEDVNIDVRNNQLIVSGESSISSNKDEGDYVVRERSYGKFSRTLQLPQGVKVCLLPRSAYTFSDIPHRRTKLRRVWRTAFWRSSSPKSPLNKLPKKSRSTRAISMVHHSTLIFMHFQLIVVVLSIYILLPTGVTYTLYLQTLCPTIFNRKMRGGFVLECSHVHACIDSQKAIASEIDWTAEITHVLANVCTDFQQFISSDKTRSQLPQWENWTLSPARSLTTWKRGGA